MKRPSWFTRWAVRLLTAAFRPRRVRTFRRGHLRIEPLEDRILLSGGVFPTPLDPLKPFDSLVFGKSHTDQFSVTGETDVYTIPLNAGQVLTAVLQPNDPSLQASLELIDPNSVTLASAAAAHPGAAVVLETAPVAAAGIYQVELVGLVGSGAYTVSLTLNAAIAMAGLTLPPSSNNTPATAQNIDGSSVALSGGADRLAVVGQSDNGSDYYSFHLTQGQTVDLALSTQSGAGGVHLDLLDPSAMVIPLLRQRAISGTIQFHL